MGVLLGQHQIVNYTQWNIIYIYIYIFEEFEKLNTEKAGKLENLESLGVLLVVHTLS